jgi:hypothetical protein
MARQRRAIGSAQAHSVVQLLKGIAWGAAMPFVWIAGIELDLRQAWLHRHEAGVTAWPALGVPLLFGAGASSLLKDGAGWRGPQATEWQWLLQPALAGKLLAAHLAGRLLGWRPTRPRSSAGCCRPRR